MTAQVLYNEQFHFSILCSARSVTHVALSELQLLHYSVPGYEGCNTIEVTYVIPSGFQGPEHPNPGQRYHGTTKVAYLPDNQEGRKVFEV